MATKAYRYMMYSMHVPVKVFQDGTFDTYGDLMSTSYQLLDALPVVAKPLEKIDVTLWFPKETTATATTATTKDDSKDDSEHDSKDDSKDDSEHDSENDCENDMQEEPLYISVAELESAIRKKPGSSLNQTLRWRPVARLSGLNTSRKTK